MSIDFGNFLIWEGTSVTRVPLVSFPESDLQGFSALSDSEKIIIAGPYRIKVTISAGDEGGFNIQKAGGGKASLASAHGSVFVDDSLFEIFDRGLNLLGNARGCFDLSW